ncbi:type I phosphomannose isomerase catalytic subunit [Anaerococcus urinomassiliensis]|uniref:type I phosphomannose isomerase catalytic subunit n=1 Tax=Anaerococcus urinomassiliensis TaxID=1745712 RepID=UPI00093B0CF0|nr:type I phosphomannose isomerase catalytic subunit [Anaerococcus urinomassiliensis]
MQKVLMLDGKFVDKIWGGERLREEFSYDIESDSVGEYWAVSAMEEFPSLIINGELAGENLIEVYKNERELFGDPKEATFPLLVKIIDAKEDLSIQVHPDDQMGKRVEDSLGKTECWYILNDNESSIIYGLNAKDKDEAVKLINERKWEEVLKEVPAKNGDFFFVPAGTVHAIKKGCLILEIQQASDVTYRLYDYDRKDKDGNLRDLHIEKSIEAIKLNDIDNKTETSVDGDLRLTNLTDNEFFQVRKYEIKGNKSFNRDSDYLIEAVIDGAGELIVDGETYQIKKGDFFILTNLVSSYEFAGDLTIVESNVVNK